MNCRGRHDELAFAMNSSTHNPLETYCVGVASRARRASRGLALASTQAKDAWLLRCAELLVSRQAEVLRGNEADLAAAPGYGLSPAQIDRLRLSPTRIGAMSQALREIAALADPIGEVIEQSTRPGGVVLRKVRVPLGVVFFIYESRPNVTADAAAICVKSGNAVILRGGKEAAQSSAAIVSLMVKALGEFGLPDDSIQLVEPLDRDAVGCFLRLPELIDVAIPRGGESLIRRVAAEARMPVIKHYTGNCHVYIDRSADVELARRIVVNSKCQRMGVCNAAESLLIHEAIAGEMLPAIGKDLIAQGIEIRGDAATRALLPEAKSASDEDFGAEYLGPIISCKIVRDLDEAISHIDRYGSHHTDAIVATDSKSIERFVREVDSAAVVVNASTRLHDGGEFGMGAEIGISTDKFHARGPCGIKELTSYKYVVRGSGQIRT
jgi:glutamate-5-semialdehyde dehydrogenase